MDIQAVGKRRRFAALRAWNRRTDTWSYRHPWRYAAVYATAASVAPVVGVIAGGSYGPAFPVAMWLVSFVVFGAMTKRKASRPRWEPLSTPPTDLTLRGDSGPVVGEDGRRWRTGSP